MGEVTEGKGKGKRYWSDVPRVWGSLRTAPPRWRVRVKGEAKDTSKEARDNGKKDIPADAARSALKGATKDPLGAARAAQGPPGREDEKEHSCP